MTNQIKNFIEENIFVCPHCGADWADAIMVGDPEYNDMWLCEKCNQEYGSAKMIKNPDYNKSNKTMKQNLKNLIGEGEKFFKDIDNYIDYHGEADKEDIEPFILTDKLVQEFSSRQISLAELAYAVGFKEQIKSLFGSSIDDIHEALFHRENIKESVIKMIVELINSKKKKIPEDCGEDCYCPYCEKEHDFNKSLDTISSKLKELYKQYEKENKEKSL